MSGKTFNILVSSKFICALLGLLLTEAGQAQIAGSRFENMFQRSNSEDYDGVNSDLYDDEEYGEDATLEEKMEIASNEDSERYLALALNHHEIRAQHSDFAALFIGPSYPWQSIGLEMTNYSTYDHAHQLAVGYGKWSFKNSKEDISFVVEAESTGLFYAQKYFPTQVLPVFFQLTGGWLFWQGEINPSGEFSADAPTSDVLRSGFHANGPVFSVNMGLNVTWTSGWFLEYSLLGLSKGFSTYEDYSSSSDRSRDAIRKQISQVATWGLFNIKLGKSF